MVDPGKWFEAQTVIAFSVIFGFLAFIFMWTLYQPPLEPAHRDIMLLLVGGLNTAVGSVIQYFLNREK